MRIQPLLRQLRILEQCGISTSLNKNLSLSEKKEWSLKAVALLDGYDIKDFENQAWKDLFDKVEKSESLDTVQFSDEQEELKWRNMLDAASELMNAVNQRTED